MLQGHVARMRAEQERSLSNAWHTGLLAARAVFASQKSPYPSLKDLLNPKPPQGWETHKAVMMRISHANNAAIEAAAAGARA